MIEWELVATIAGGGFGIVFFILVILALIVKLLAIGVKKFPKGGSEGGAKKQK